jgi:hypothetical protein
MRFDVISWLAGLNWHDAVIGVAAVAAGIVAACFLVLIAIVLVAHTRDTYLENARLTSAYSEGPPFAKYDLRFWVLVILGMAAAVAMLQDAPRIALAVFAVYLILAAPILINAAAVIFRMAQAVWCRLNKRVYNPLQEAYAIASRTPGGPSSCYRDKSVCKKYAWALPTPQALAVVARHAPIVEVGAGTGYWAWLLWQMGVDITAYDMSAGITLRNHYHELRPGFFPVRKCDAEEAARRHPERTLLLSWPPDTSMASRALKAYGGDTVIYIGFNSKRYDVYTGDDEFHTILAERWAKVEELMLPSWYPCQDCLRVYRRK